MKTQIILVDYENVQPDLLPALKIDNVQIRVFVGPLSKLPIDLAFAMQELGDRAKYIKVSKAGPNALDMHLAFYLGELSQQFPSQQFPDADFWIVSKDQDYDPLRTHLKGRGIDVERTHDLASIPFLGIAPAKKVPAKKVSAVTPAQQISAAADWLKRHPENNRPGTAQALKNSLKKAVFADQLDEPQLEAVVQGLIEKGYVSEDKGKLHYPERPNA